MRNTLESVKLGQEILALIDRKRTETGDSGLGSSIERLILESQIRDLEQNIFDDPGAIEPWLIRRRRDP